MLDFSELKLTVPRELSRIPVLHYDPFPPLNSIYPSYYREEFIATIEALSMLKVPPLHDTIMSRISSWFT